MEFVNIEINEKTVKVPLIKKISFKLKNELEAINAKYIHRLSELESSGFDKYDGNIIRVINALSSLNEMQNLSEMVNLKMLPEITYKMYRENIIIDWIKKLIDWKQLTTENKELLSADFEQADGNIWYEQDMLHIESAVDFFRNKIGL